MIAAAHPLEVPIRRPRPDEGERVIEIWRKSVDATHDFLSPEDRAAIDKFVCGFLPQTPLWLAVNGDDRPIAFMLIDDGHMEALFVDPDYHSKGVGRALVRHALLLHSAMTTDVNEQNGQALGFYERMGFIRTGRSPLDGQGRAYPLLHLAYRPDRIAAPSTATKTLFLPGAIGSASFWKPVAVEAQLDGVFFAWPGLGAEPAASDVNSIDDLVMLAAAEITEPVNLIAQSMGGVIAIRLALAFPDLVSKLVLVATSGGVPVTDLGGSDWRPDYFATFPNAAEWIAHPVGDLSGQIASIRAPTLLIWGDADPISPVAVGKRLASLLPNSRLSVVQGGEHNLAQTHGRGVATEIRRHLDALE